MGVDHLRTALIEQIKTGDESFVRVINAVAEAYRLEHSESEVDRAREVQGYEPNGSPITARDLARRALESEEDIAAGRLYTTEEVRKQLGR